MLRQDVRGYAHGTIFESMNVCGRRMCEHAEFVNQIILHYWLIL